MGSIMVRSITSCLIILLLVGCAAEKVVQKPKINCTILPFESRTGMKPGEAESVMDMLAASLQKTGRFVVIERKQLNAVMQEQGFQAAQEGETNVAKAAKILAVHKMISGSIGKLGDNYVLNIKMIDVGTSEVTIAISRSYDDDLEDIGEEFLPNIVKEIMVAIDGPLK
jgi:TolB-like protein